MRKQTRGENSAIRIACASQSKSLLAWDVIYLCCFKPRGYRLYNICTRHAGADPLFMQLLLSSIVRTETLFQCKHTTSASVSCCLASRYCLVVWAEEALVRNWLVLRVRLCRRPSFFAREVNNGRTPCSFLSQRGSTVIHSGSLLLGISKSLSLFIFL